MNILEFLKEYLRMCRFYADCNECPLFSKDCLLDATPMYTTRMSEEKLIQFIDGVEDWSRNHPLIINWTKVPHNTPVLVRNSPISEWQKRYFCAYIPHATNGKFATFYDGDGNSACGIVQWYYCKLAPEVDITLYLIEEEN